MRATGCVFTGIYTPFVYIADHADQLGVSKDDAVLLLSVLGISNTIGRVVAGWLADRPTVDSVSFHNVCLLIAGLATCVVPVLTSYPLICVYLVVYGLCIGMCTESHLTSRGYRVVIGHVMM